MLHIVVVKKLNSWNEQEQGYKIFSCKFTRKEMLETVKRPVLMCSAFDIDILPCQACADAMIMSVHTLLSDWI